RGPLQAVGPPAARRRGRPAGRTPPPPPGACPARARSGPAPRRRGARGRRFLRSGRPAAGGGTIAACGSPHDTAVTRTASSSRPAGHALLLDCRTGTETAVPLNPAAAGLTLLVIDTRARHALADGRYATRRRACEQAASLLGVRSLRDVTGAPGALARLPEPALRRPAGA